MGRNSKNHLPLTVGGKSEPYGSMGDFTNYRHSFIVFIEHRDLIDLLKQAQAQSKGEWADDLIDSIMYTEASKVLVQYSKAGDMWLVRFIGQESYYDGVEINSIRCNNEICHLLLRELNNPNKDMCDIWNDRFFRK